MIAGLALARLAFTLMDPKIAFEIERPDGAAVGAGAGGLVLWRERLRRVGRPAAEPAEAAEVL